MMLPNLKGYERTIAQYERASRDLKYRKYLSKKQGKMNHTDAELINHYRRHGELIRILVKHVTEKM